MAQNRDTDSKLTYSSYPYPVIVLGAGWDSDIKFNNALFLAFIVIQNKLEL